jgi:hypothetical protein
MLTQAQRNERQRAYRKANGNAYTKKYEKTPSGFLMRVYRNMKSRITGVQKHKSHLYLGKELLSKEEFYEWAASSPMFLVLYQQYVNSGFDRKQAPTVDRKDSSKGYSLDNMEWVTHSVNSSRGAKSKYANPMYS